VEIVKSFTVITTLDAMKYHPIFGSVVALAILADPAMRAEASPAQDFPTPIASPLIAQASSSTKSPAEIEQIAKSVSVEILTGSGSGVIIHRQGNLYTLITNRHVVCGSGNCDESRLTTNYRFSTADGQVHQVAKQAVQLLRDSAGNSLDLAIVQFKSNRSYQVAQVAEPDRLKVDDTIHTTGFSKEQGWLFGSGQANAVVNKRLAGDRGGYTIVYDAETLPGMSGGGAFDNNGRLVAIHGQGDRLTENTQVEMDSFIPEYGNIGRKIGINRGIPVRWVVQSLSKLGISLGNKQPPDRTRMNYPMAAADEFFIAGVNKFIDPGEDFQAGRREAIDNLNYAIALNPGYTHAYIMRAYVKSKSGDRPGALADYDTAISLNPKYTAAYTQRGNLKQERERDWQAALDDYNKAIALNPKYETAYLLRAILKQRKMKDLPGALADYNKTITLNSKHSEAYALRGLLKGFELNNPPAALIDLNYAIKLNPKYAAVHMVRGVFKYAKMKDFQGALADLNQAITLNPKYVDAYIVRLALKADKLNDYQGALADCNEIISFNPRLASPYMIRGLLKRSHQDRPGAISDFRTAVKISRENGSVGITVVAVEELRKLGVTE
jgi:tetratricopeptide (TPR) repeat protein/S1-C subfamily serine protease